MRHGIHRFLPAVLCASLLGGCGGSGADPVPPKPAGGVDWLVEASVDTLQARMERGELSAVALTEACLARIDGLDRRGPGLHAMLELNPDAVAIAAALDAERVERGARGPLHGIPVVLKGNVDTGDSMATTAGALALAGHRAAADAFLVARLRQAGAVLLGKTNLSEWANFRSTSASSGWSALGGQTKNPYVLDRSPCGSSSGTGAAVAASLAPLGVGTETDGSIVCPASFMGLVGIKPTLGLVSRAGVIPIAHSQDTAGPMARSVRDAALLLQALAGADAADPAATGLPEPLPDYAAAAVPGDLSGLRIGVWRGWMGDVCVPPVNDAFAAALATLEALGAELVDPVDFGDQDGLDDAEYAVLLHEFRADLQRYFAERGSPDGIRSLEDVIAFNEEHAAEAMPHFGQEIFLEAVATGPLDDPAYLDALGVCRRLARERLDAVLRERRLDAVVAPTNGPPWKIDLEHGDDTAGMVSSSTLPAVAGTPALTLPVGEDRGLPLGLTVFGAAFSEPVLLRVAAAVEAASGARRAPKFLETVAAGQ